MKGNKEILAIICAVFVTVVAAVLLTGSHLKDPDAPVPEAPVPEQSTLDYLVKVTAHNPKASHTGSGIVVKHGGHYFVLTSKMIFTKGDVGYTVADTWNSYTAELVRLDDRLGLVALKLQGYLLGGVEIDEAPNIPPGASVLVLNLENTFVVNVVRYLTDPDWMILDGGLPGTCTGSPIMTYDNNLAGVVIGINTENAEEAFAVGNHAIREFVKELIHDMSFDVPREPVFPYNPNDMGNVFRKPTNPRNR